MKIEFLNQISTNQLSQAFKRFQKNRAGKAVGYLAEKGIAKFHCDRMLKWIEKAHSNSSVHALIKTGEIQAIFGTNQSVWHEEIYGYPYYKINPFFVFDENPIHTQEIIQHLISTFDEAGSVYTLRVDAQQHHVAYELTRQGFVFVGTSIRYNLGEDKFKNHPLLDEKTNNSLTIRDYDSIDLEAVQQIAKAGHRHSHFFHEARFPFEKTQELFTGWIERCAGGQSAKMWIAENQEHIVGFATCLFNTALHPYIGKKIGIIDFIVVDPSAQGLGVGKQLLQHVLQWFTGQVDDVELRTMADNLQAVRFYEKHRFRILSSDHHFHLWK